MTNRFPLIVDTSDNKIKELSNGDNLDLTGSGIVNANSIETTALTVNTLNVTDVTVDGTQLADVATSGSYTDLENTPVLFSGSFNDLTNRPFIPSIVSELNDVDTTVPSGGDILQWNAATGKYTPTAVDLTVDLSTKFINEFADVIGTGDTNNKFLKYYAGAWRPSRILYSEISETPNTISIEDLQALVASSTDFADFQTRIAAL